MRISKLREEDFRKRLGEIIDVYLDGYADVKEYAYHKRRDVKNYVKWLYRCDPDAFIVAFEENSIIGFVAGAKNWWDRVYGDIGEIHELVVKRDFRGKGIGKKILEEEIRLLEEKNKIIGLWVGEKNYRAIKFYERFGFETVGKVGVWLRMIRKS
ncbi:MAG: N-acetyltransferase [Thermoplasmata archaeon]|nr:MAG: N-acetyltransferase [Thermoplasmata archaeon]